MIVIMHHLVESDLLFAHERKRFLFSLICKQMLNELFKIVPIATAESIFLIRLR